MDQRESMKSTVILITEDGMGHADTELQHKLVATYLRLLVDSHLLPNSICFYTDGIKLAVEGSPVLDLLKELEENGVRLILCSTCLNYFGLLDKVRVGIVGGMTDILTAQVNADKVITL